MLNGWEIVLVLAMALIFFGAKKLPELARGMGQGIREFKRATREASDELQALTTVEPVQPSVQPVSQEVPVAPVPQPSSSPSKA